jgi:chemotaxis protein methyltransferase CheR
MVAEQALPAHVERRLRELAYQHTGIVLGPEKATLLATRIGKRMRQLALRTYSEYLKHFDTDPNELQSFVNAITTNTTAFWREPDHFGALTGHVEERIARGQRRFRLWCAASSTGQEPWTMALVLLPLVRSRFLDLKILATDIDTEVLERARQGVYADLSGVPIEVRSWGFSRLSDGRHQVSDPVRELVRFAQLNLTRPPFPMRGPLDVVFCRNVMIYLDQPTRGRLAREFERLLTPGGLAVVGHSETLNGLGRKLKPVRASVYRMPEEP